MKLKFNNFNREENNTISNDESLNSMQDSQYQSYAPPQEFNQPEIVEGENNIENSCSLFESAMRDSYNNNNYPNNYIQDNSIDNSYINNNYVDDSYFKNNQIDDSIIDNKVNDNTTDKIKEKISGLLRPKEIRQYARNDLKYKPVLALFLNYFTIVLSFSIIGVMLLAFFGINNLAFRICGVLGLLMYILSIIVLPDFYKIFLDLRRNNTPSKLFSNKRKTIPLFVVLFIKGLIFTLISLLFPVIGVLLTKVISSTILKFIIYALLSIIMIVLIVIIAIKYSLAEMICVDDNGPIQSLKLSRKLLKNNTMRYIKSILPIIGWSLLVSLIIGILSLLPAMMIGLNQGFNLIAGIMVLFTIFIVSCIFMFPVYSYFFMIKAEFYDNATNKEMNVLQNKRKKLPIVLILSVSLILILSSSFLLYMLPVDMTIDELKENITATTSNEQMIDTYGVGLYYSIPDSYTIMDQTDTDIYYIKNNRYTMHIGIMEGEYDFEEEIDEYDAEEMTLGAMDGYWYSFEDVGGITAKYGFSFLYNDCKYVVVGDVEKDVKDIVSSIKEVGMMEF